MTSAAYPAAGAWLRGRRRTRGFALLWSLQGAFWLAVAAVVSFGVLLADGQPVGEAVLGLACAGIALAVGAAMLRYAVGCRRAGVRIDAAGVTVANPLRTAVVPLRRAHTFTAGLTAAAFGNPTPGIVLELTDGSRLCVWALAREGLVWNGARDRASLEPTAERLNAALAAARATG